MNYLHVGRYRIGDRMTYPHAIITVHGFPISYYPTRAEAEEQMAILEDAFVRKNGPLTDHDPEGCVGCVDVALWKERFPGEEVGEVTDQDDAPTAVAGSPTDTTP